MRLLPQLSTFSFHFLMLIIKKNYNYCRWKSLIYHVQKIWSPSFLLPTSSISRRTKFFHLDDSPNITTHTQQVMTLFSTIYCCGQLLFKMKNINSTLHSHCPVGWGSIIHPTASLQRGKTPLQTRVLDMTLNNLMVRFQ